MVVYRRFVERNRGRVGVRVWQFWTATLTETKAMLDFL